MNFHIKTLTSREWKDLSSVAHLLCFGKQYPDDFERIDFAMVAINDQDEPLGFITALQLNKNHIYWQYGGAFPGLQGTINSYKIYAAARDLCAQSYKAITTVIENDNRVMLKFALKLGFVIIGVKHLFEKTCVELFLNLEAT